MTAWHFGIIAITSYLLGSLSFAIIICKLTMHQDIRQFGSGNAGLTNAYRIMGGKKTLLVLFGDIAKGAMGIGLGGILAGPMGKLVAGIFVILGHVFPVYFGFRGGKGVLVGGVLLAFFDLRIFCIAMTIFFLVVFLTRWISLGSMLAAMSFPVSTWYFYRDGVMTGIALALALVVVYLHRGNIKRICSGTENRFAWKQKIATQTKEEDASCK